MRRPLSWVMGLTGLLSMAALAAVFAQGDCAMLGNLGR